MVGSTAYNTSISSFGNLDGAAAQVLVVDDEPAFRQTMLGLLKRLGARAFDLGPQPDLIEKIGASGARLLFLDLSLSGNDAIQILGGLGRAGFTGRVALISGHDAETIERVRSYGLGQGLHMISWLEKPASQSGLQRALMEAGIGSNPSDEVPIAVDLREAIASGWLSIHYQPQILLHGHEPCGVEALVRLQHPELGNVRPDQFVPSLDERELGLLTGYMIANAAKHAVNFEAISPQLRVSVNTDLNVLQSGAVLDMIRDYWGPQTALPLVIEITEGIALGDENVRDLALQLQLYGVGLSLDDFGAEFSSFDRLQTIPFAEVKLDKRYVMGAGHSHSLQAICRSAASFAEHFGLRVVAEGVETADDLKVVTEAGFDVGQGYFFSRPQPFDEVCAYLEQAMAEPEMVARKKRA